MATQDRPGIRHKTFTYAAAVRWAGGRAGMAQSDGKPSVRVASPPEFKGEPGVWSPEDLYVAAINACTMTTFAAYAQHKKLSLVAYESQAEGTLEFVDGGYRFTRVTLRPVIRVSEAADVEAATQIVQDAHAACFITNSVAAEVSVQPEVVVGPEGESARS